MKRRSGVECGKPADMSGRMSRLNADIVSRVRYHCCTTHGTHLPLSWHRRGLTKSPAVARKDALQPIQFLLQYWPSSLSKVNYFHVIRRSVCHFLLVINSNLGLISHRFRDMVSFPLKKHIFLPRYVQPQIWKCFPCTAFLYFFTQRALAQG